MAGTSGKEDVHLAKTTAADDAHERRKANPDAADMADPKEVWKEGETTPSPDRGAAVARGGGRVADGGDLDKAQPSPYSTETQADALAKQSTGKEQAPGVEKPKR